MNNGMPTPTVEGLRYLSTHSDVLLPSERAKLREAAEILERRHLSTPATPAAQEEMPTHSAECSNSNGACFCGLEGRLRSRLQQEIADHAEAKRTVAAAVERAIAKHVQIQNGLEAKLHEAQDLAASQIGESVAAEQRADGAESVLSSVRIILAGTDINSLPNDFPVDGMAGERMKDLLNTRRELKAVEEKLQQEIAARQAAEERSVRLGKDNDVMAADLALMIEMKRHQQARAEAAEDQNRGLREALKFCVGYLEDNFAGTPQGEPTWLKKYRALSKQDAKPEKKDG